MIETVGELIELLSELDHDALVRIPRYSQEMNEDGEIIDGGLEWCTIDAVNDAGDRVDLEISVVGEQFQKGIILKYRRINLFGGGGIGKSGLAGYLFWRLKKDQFKVFQAPEYIKLWTYINREPESFDQVTVFGHQMKYEELPLRQEDLIVSDSPLFQQIVYAKHNNTAGWEGLLKIAQEFEKTYPSINLMLDRTNVNYRSEGRYRDLEYAQKIDRLTIELLEEQNLKYHTASALREEEAYDLVKNILSPQLWSVNCMFMTASGVAADLNRALRDDPKKVHKAVNEDGFMYGLNAMLRYYGEQHWKITIIFADRNFTKIERFDVISYDGSTHIVSDRNFTDWFDKRLKRRYNIATSKLL